MGKSDAWIEPPIVADLENPFRAVQFRAQRLAFLDAHAKRFFDQHMFARRNGLTGQRHMKLIATPMMTASTFGSASISSNLE